VWVWLECGACSGIGISRGRHTAGRWSGLFCGERVLHLTRDFGVLWGTTQEITLGLGCVYTIRDGRIARWDVYLDRADALEAVGLAK
jgi:hypothetical protein